MANDIGITDAFRATAASFGRTGFTTKDFAERYRTLHPSEWQALVSRYGVGGKGSGHPYSANNRLGSMLRMLFRAGDLHMFKYGQAPTDWGSPVIRRWSVSLRGTLADDSMKLDPADVENDAITSVPAWADREYREGTPQLRTHLRRERDSALPHDKKAAFRAEHGKLSCERCGVVPSEMYGEPFGDAAIEVHHTVMVRDFPPGYSPKLSDLQCLCASCHRVIHAELRDQAKSKED